MELFPQRRIFSVFEITAEIKRSLERLGIVWVQGEISNFKHHSSGHMYFTLKDKRAQVKAACFRNNNCYLKFRPEDGLEVLVRGRIAVYEPRGDYQLVAEYMEPVGLGSLQLAFDQLKEKLRKEGLFEAARKKPLPLLPRKIGIVTSPTGAAIRDILQILERRNAALHVLLFPAKVQGIGAAGEIGNGIRYFNSRSDIDVIIIGRGGGSMEDLWAFNEEHVARFIVRSRIPIISAVGHEVDFTISDFVADLRAPTPSAAAEMVSGAREELRTATRSFYGRMVRAMQSSLERRQLLLQRWSENRAFDVAPNKIREFQQRLDENLLRTTQAVTRFTSRLRHREQVLHMRLNRIDLHHVLERRRNALARDQHLLGSHLRTLLERERSRLRLAGGRMDALSPLAILGRGYAICRDGNGAVLKDVRGVEEGQTLDITLARGGLFCRVETIRGAGGVGE